MISVHRWLEADGDNTKMIMQVHDELVFEVASNDIERTQMEISTLMTGAADLTVRLEVDAGVGVNWHEAH
jgi:DNA polymerase-1